MNRKVDTLIIGGGVTGISLAGFLKHDDYLIIEKESDVGGYCKTIKRNGFVWDYSGHFFHFRDKEIKKHVLENMSSEIMEIEKKSHIYYQNNLIDFPFQYNIHQLPVNEFIECLQDLSDREDKIPNTFKEFVINSLGESISNKFIIPYNEKLYKCDLNDLDVNSMGRFFPKKIEYKEILQNIRFKNKVDSYNDTFIYPVDGCFEFIKSLLKRIKSDNLLTNTELEYVNIDEKKVITNKGEIYYNKLINTSPFNFFYEKTTLKKYDFNFNKVVVFNLGFDRETTIDSNWIYFPGSEIFYRVGFYNNILNTKNMSLYVEVSLNKEDKIDKQQLLDKILLDLKKHSIVNNHELVDYEFLVLNPAYVHITKESNDIYKSWCDELNPLGVYSIGRYGSWTYCSIEDNIIEAKKIANLL